MQHRIIGTTLPVLEITLDRDERIVSEPGELSWMTSTIELRTSTQMAGARGVFGALKRAVAGGGLFLTEYSARGGPGSVAFATQVPGQILPIEIRPGQEYIIHRHGFLCGTPGIELSIAFQRTLGAGIFGGEGMILEKLSGTSTAWIELSGEVVNYQLQAGETLRVHPGHVGMFESSVTFGMTTISGIKNAIFGGDGIFLATLTGPGQIWLQSAPIANIAHALQPYLHIGGSEAAAGGSIGGAVASGVLRDLLK